MQQIAEFCPKWLVTEFALFGSVLRDDFHAGSDIDILLDIDPNATRSLTETPPMRDELEGVFDRKVDLIFKAAIGCAKRNFFHDVRVFALSTPELSDGYC
ncbi:MAG: nucleotidyltransferase family protein [Geitlerinemataceae cyanobacterium]